MTIRSNPFFAGVMACALVLTTLIVNPVSAHAFATLVEEPEEEESEEDNPQGPIKDDEDVNNLARGIVKFFGGIRKNRNKKQTERIPGAVIQFRIIDWAGRPTDGTARFENDEHTYEATSVASRGEIRGVVLGTYMASLTPVRDVAPAPYEITFDREVTYRPTFVVQEEDASTGGLKDRVGPLPTAPLPTGPSIAVPESLGAPPSRPDLPERNLAQGERLVVSGSGMDREGRPTDVLVIVSKDGVDIGYARSVASRFSMFDLALGDYVFRARHLSRHDGEWREHPVTIGRGVARVVMRVER